MAWGKFFTIVGQVSIVVVIVLVITAVAFGAYQEMKKKK